MDLEPLFHIDLPPPVEAATTIEPIRPKSTSVSLSPYYMMPQKKVARLLGLTVSTLSKRWSEASHGRVWPFRRVLIIDAEIKKCMKCGEDVDALQRRRKEMLAPVKISTKVNPPTKRFVKLK